MTPPLTNSRNKPRGEKAARPSKAYGFSQPIYEAEVIEKILSFRTMRHDFGLWRDAVCRFFVIVAFFIDILWMSWWDRQIWSYIGEADIDLAQSLRRHRHGRKITEKLLALGPTYIKVGQSLSTRVDLLRREYIDELAELQDRVPMFALTDVYRTIEEELGDKPEEIFAQFDPVPIAAASLGQVHRVTLPDGQEAVIKVQRPNLIRLFRIDLSILQKMAGLLQQNTDLGRGREWRQIVDEFGRKLFEEIDYIREGRNADRFRRNFTAIPDILIPEIHWKYTSRRVITMEYLPGIKVNDLESLEIAHFSRSETAIRLVKAYFQQLLLDGFFHADPHPGNIVVNAQGKIVIYDFGMVDNIPDEIRIKMVNAFLNIVNKRTDAILRNLVDLNMVTPGADLEEIRTVVDWALDNYYDVPHDQLNFEQLADELAEVMYYYPFKLPASFTFMFRALITLEGVATTLYPQIQFMSIAVDYARDFVERTYLLDRLLNPINGVEGYKSLLKDAMELMGFQGKDRHAAGAPRVRLYYEEWKPLSRYVKAGFLLFAFSQTVMVIFGMAFLFWIFAPRMPHSQQWILLVGLAAFLTFYLLIVFGTLLLLPSRKKPRLFNPPKRQASSHS